MKNQIAPLTTPLAAKRGKVTEVDRAYVRLAGAIADVPDEIILAVLMARGSWLKPEGKASSH